GQRLPVRVAAAVAMRDVRVRLGRVGVDDGGQLGLVVDQQQAGVADGPDLREPQAAGVRVHLGPGPLQPGTVGRGAVGAACGDRGGPQAGACVGLDPAGADAADGPPVGGVGGEVDVVVFGVGVGLLGQGVGGDGGEAHAAPASRCAGTDTTGAGAHTRSRSASRTTAGPYTGNS